MKKIISLLASTAAAASVMTCTLSSDAAQNSYVPKLYFTAEKSDCMHYLKNGSVYIDIKELPAEGTSLSARVFLDDKLKSAHHVIAKWRSESEYIKVKDFIDPITLCGHSPYKNFTNPASIVGVQNDELNSISVSYSTLTDIALPLTGNNSDDYPLGGFTASIAPDTPVGKYCVEFMTDVKDGRCNVFYGLDVANGDTFPSGPYAQPLRINISDRSLGNVNNNSLVDANDATLILKAATKIQAGHDSGLSPEALIAADVDGDGMVTPKDATLVLKYSTMASAGKVKSIDEFIEKKLYIEKK